MFDLVGNLAALYLAYFNAGMDNTPVDQFADYINARIEVWAFSKIGK